MKVQHATGPRAGVLKYDILTCLSVLGLNGSPRTQTTMMRLMSLITARYNWQTERLSVGQREMATLWSVNERTVKREIKRMTEDGLLICRRPGVKGRVAEYRLNTQRVAEMSEGCWGLVGSDFVTRMRERFGEGAPKVVSIADRRAISLETKTPIRDAKWCQVIQILEQSDPSICQAWFMKVEFVACEEGTLRLRAPSAFAARYIEQHLMRVLLDALQPVFGAVKHVVISTKQSD